MNDAEVATGIAQDPGLCSRGDDFNIMSGAFTLGFPIVGPSLLDNQPRQLYSIH